MAAKESNPKVADSSLVPGITAKPLSTLIPGTMPFSVSNWMKFLPSLVACLTVSEKRITPLM
jgi:hypothetical protein